MQDIYLDKIHLHNVATYTEDMDFDFPEGFTLIVGKNGSGKSTIPKAIALALYEDSGGTDELPLSEFVNHKIGKDLEILLEFRIVENEITDKYEIQLYQNHKKYHNKMILLKNGIDISGKSKTQTYEMLDHLL